MRAWAAAILMLAGCASTPIADPLANARAGMTQCYTPDVARRSCRGLVAFEFHPDGSIMSREQVLIEANTVIFVSSTGYVRGAALCGPIRVEDYERAEFAIDGEPATAEQTAAMREMMVRRMSRRVGEICTTFEDAGDTYRVRARWNGETLPVKTMVWVRPSDGYAVRAP
jgi:hypothetical protein